MLFGNLNFTDPYSLQAAHSLTALCSPAYWGTFAAQLIAMPAFGIGAAIWLAREARREAAAALLDPPVSTTTTDPAHAHRHRESDEGGLAEEEGPLARLRGRAGTQEAPGVGDPEAGGDPDTGLKEALLPSAQRQQQQQQEELQQRGGTDGLGSGSPTLGLLAVYQAFAMLAGLVGEGAIRSFWEPAVVSLTAVLRGGWGRSGPTAPSALLTEAQWRLPQPPNVHALRL